MEEEKEKDRQIQRETEQAEKELYFNDSRATAEAGGSGTCRGGGQRLQLEADSS